MSDRIDKGELENRLRSRGAGAPCPSCGLPVDEGRGFTGVIDLLGQIDPDTPEHIRTVGVICPRCGHIDLHVLGVLDL